MKKLHNIFYTKISTDNITLQASEINGDINSILLKKLKKRIGNKCSKDGYVDNDTIKILDRTIGVVNSSHFNGDINYSVKSEISTCNPLKGDILECTVIGINKMGIMCYNKPLLIALSKIHHMDNLTKFESIEKDMVIMVEVLCSKFELNDTEINLIGKIYE